MEKKRSRSRPHDQLQPSRVEEPAATVSTKDAECKQSASRPISIKKPGTTSIPSGEVLRSQSVGTRPPLPRKGINLSESLMNPSSKHVASLSPHLTGQSPSTNRFGLSTSSVSVVTSSSKEKPPKHRVATAPRPVLAPKPHISTLTRDKPASNGALPVIVKG